MVILMTVNPGYMGQQLVPQVLKKVEKVRNLKKNMVLISKFQLMEMLIWKIFQHDKIWCNTLVLGSSGLFRKDRSIKQSVDLIKEKIDKLNV